MVIRAWVCKSFENSTYNRVPLRRPQQIFRQSSLLEHDKITLAKNAILLAQRMSLIMNHAMPWLELVHHHLVIYDRTGPAWKLIQPWLHIGMHDKDAWPTFNSEDQGSHGPLCFYLIDIIYIFILKCRIPSSTLIFMPHNSQDTSIIGPVTFSCLIAKALHVQYP